MSRESLVTVVTPSYNQGQYIPYTLDAVLDQDYRQLEYYVIDGGSTDETLDVLRRRDDPRLTWLSEKDRGQSDALNKGLRRAIGEYLTYLNSDDILLPGAVRFVIDYFESHPDVDLVFGDCQLIEGNMQVIGELCGAPFDLQKALLGVQRFPQPGTFWRRRVTEQIGLFDESLHFVMDFDYWIRAALDGCELRYVPGTRSAFRLHTSSKTMREKVGFWNDWNTILDKVYDRQNLPDQLLAVKDTAYRNIQWNRLKAEWATGSYDREALRPYLHSSSPKYRAIARLMQLESISRLPLLSWLDSGYARLSGKRIIR